MEDQSTIQIDYQDDEVKQRCMRLVSSDPRKFSHLGTKAGIIGYIEKNFKNPILIEKRMSMMKEILESEDEVVVEEDPTVDLLEEIETLTEEIETEKKMRSSDVDALNEVEKMIDELELLLEGKRKEASELRSRLSNLSTMEMKMEGLLRRLNGDQEPPRVVNSYANMLSRNDIREFSTVMNLYSYSAGVCDQEARLLLRSLDVVKPDSVTLKTFKRLIVENFETCFGFQVRELKLLNGSIHSAKFDSGVLTVIDPFFTILNTGDSANHLSFSSLDLETAIKTSITSLLTSSEFLKSAPRHSAPCSLGITNEVVGANAVHWDEDCSYNRGYFVLFQGFCKASYEMVYPNNALVALTPCLPVVSEYLGHLNLQKVIYHYGKPKFPVEDYQLSNLAYLVFSVYNNRNKVSTVQDPLVSDLESIVLTTLTPPHQVKKESTAVFSAGLLSLATHMFTLRKVSTQYESVQVHSTDHARPVKKLYTITFSKPTSKGSKLFLNALHRQLMGEVMREVLDLLRIYGNEENDSLFKFSDKLDAIYSVSTPDLEFDDCVVSLPFCGCKVPISITGHAINDSKHLLIIPSNQLKFGFSFESCLLPKPSPVTASGAVSCYKCRDEYFVHVTGCYASLFGSDFVISSVPFPYQVQERLENCRLISLEQLQNYPQFVDFRHLSPTSILWFSQVNVLRSKQLFLGTDEQARHLLFSLLLRMHSEKKLSITVTSDYIKVTSASSFDSQLTTISSIDQFKAFVTPEHFTSFQRVAELEKELFLDNIKIPYTTGIYINLGTGFRSEGFKDDRTGLPVNDFQFLRLCRRGRYMHRGHQIN